MTPSDYREISQNLTDHILDVQTIKQTEYNGEGPDVLQSFKTAADLQGLTPIQALLGMMAKHTTSIYDILGECDCYGLKRDDALILEKIVDHINYLYLAWALVCERRENASVEEIVDEAQELPDNVVNLYETANAFLRLIGITPEIDKGQEKIDAS